MQYILLIYNQEKAWEALSESEKGAIFAEYGKFTHALKESGKMIAGDALEPTLAATTVRVRDGKSVISDGPFAETKEQLGGYYLIEADNLDDAQQIAAQIPSARMGRIEVRPIMKH